MKDQLVTFYTAKLAKEKGFDWKCLDNYNSEGIVPGYDSLIHISHYYDSVEEYLFTKNSDSNFHKDWVTAPTQSLLQKWLREEHDIHCVVNVNPMSWHWALFKTTRAIRLQRSGRGKGMFYTYEEALEEGLQEALRLIK